MLLTLSGGGWGIFLFLKGSSFTEISESCEGSWHSPTMKSFEMMKNDIATLFLKLKNDLNLDCDTHQQASLFLSS